MDAASVVQLRRTNDSRARVLEISAQLRAAVADGDDAGIARLLGDLLRFRGSSRAQSIALQQRALQSLVYLLRSAAMNDELTGLHNRRVSPRRSAQQALQARAPLTRIASSASGPPARRDALLTVSGWRHASCQD